MCVRVFACVRVCARTRACMCMCVCVRVCVIFFFFFFYSLPAKTLLKESVCMILWFNYNVTPMDVVNV